MSSPAYIKGVEVQTTFLLSDGTTNITTVKLSTDRYINYLNPDNIQHINDMLTDILAGKSINYDRKMPK